MRWTGRGTAALTEITLRPADERDHPALWAMLEPVFCAGDTYAVNPGIGRAEALAFWCGGTHRAFMAEAEGQALGSYYICPNQGGGGAHVCNCGFVTAAAAQGRGVARAMLAHALDTARAMGFAAMQFNFVVETNTRALKLWLDHGFEVVGRLPGAFRHPVQGEVDALVMYRRL
ncbi:GNAT family N-acetyltransferase [Rhodobacteraceae bacterium 2376]|uniref:GNAT family N-acetyltransferase n=1 Tax=Rhabdonatronobacter sediminivivens TaxID=2743469 RepID=A0A7Z0I1Q7_9RHOB|nr:GNAT family N-acetyltransferase [Rhabdonatronobacter sediminivivens]